ncbi:hypothetical protein BC008_29905 [Mastigocoleus testarum BC008]|uniref:Uncharacterized protein n=2 Tax=Mastigocoleus TaxID=996924 RepID=A0A0V7ZSQ7_9CYAN|nr:hypothetical protein BC008_29905 [Mastigocoleus testarum BC008]
MTIMMIEIEEKSEPNRSIANLKPNLASLCPIPDPGIFAEKPSDQDDSLSDNQHPMIIPRTPVVNEEKESDSVSNNGCYQIAKYSLSRKSLKSREIPLEPKYRL